MSYLQKLLNISSASFTEQKPDSSWLEEYIIPEQLKNEYINLLSMRNGFYAFESALLIYPSQNTKNIIGAYNWNTQFNWHKNYNLSRQKYIFFGSDIFSEQFTLSHKGIEKFNPETGEMTYLSATIDEFCKLLLEDYNYQTGWAIAHDWQTINAPLIKGKRLIPKRPFILGGSFEAEQMVEIDITSAMQKYCMLYQQTKEAPNGTSVTIQNWI